MGRSLEHTTETVGPLLDSAAAELVRLQDQGPNVVMPDLSRGLDDVRRGLDDVRRWQQFCAEVLRTHPIHELFLEDPFTKHSFAQPRGYPGDADLLDYIYGHKGPNGASRLGSALFDYSTNVQSSAAVRERRAIIARLIDQVAERHSSARILSLAAGHLREAELSSAIQSRVVKEFVAFDQDATSLSVVKETYGNNQLVTQQGLIRSLLSRKHQFTGFHLVYAAGLFDYLSDRTATHLTQVMFEMLAPNGRLVIANFAPSLQDIGYMEAYMRWQLVYRTEADISAIARGISQSDIAGQEVYWDSRGCMVFLEVRKT